MRWMSLTYGKTCAVGVVRCEVYVNKLYIVLKVGCLVDA
jgi:hypothetical protein